MSFPFTVIKKFKDEIKGLKNILNVIKITRVIKRTRNKWNKKKIKYARWWDKRYLRIVGFRFNGFRTKMQVLGKNTWLWRRNRIKTISKERINEIKRLNEEVKNNKDELLDNLLDNEKKFSELLKDLEYEKHDALHNIVVLEPKLIKLEISSERIDRIKNMVLSS